MSDAGLKDDLAAGVLRPRSVCVFCGARSGDDPRWAEGATEFGRRAALAGWRIVYGGGNIGSMGSVAEGALSVGGEVVGVIPRLLMERELAHRGLAQLITVSDMAERKTRMIAMSDAFVALPGGLGTLDELFEVLTLHQLGEHDRPIMLWNQDGYWTPLIEACRAMRDNGFVKPADLDAMEISDSIEDVLARLDVAVSAA